MNLFPSDFEIRTGFDQIRGLVKGRCHTSLGQEWVDEMVFSADHATVTEALSLTEEFRQILLSGAPFPSLDITDVRPVLDRLRIPNTFAEPAELMEIAALVQEALEAEDFFLKQADGRTGGRADKRTSGRADRRTSGLADKRTGGQADRLMEMVISKRIPDPASRLPDLVSRILTPHGEVRDGASKELGRIRREIVRLEAEVGKRMEKVFAESKRQGWVEEDTGVTVREGRLVIPFRSAHKRKIQGVVHDESATGQTVFVEPVELFEMNNEVRELRYAERREIIRILTSVADEIRPFREELTEIIRLLGFLDFLRAKARLAVDIGGALCRRVEDKPFLQWEEAVHPLLLFTLKKSGRKPIPLSIRLDPGSRVLVISGPNAGGKSVCLKSVGLLQYMLQCGLLPPAREDSVFGLFDQIMIDIGDQQSLENDLSTYTSKLLNMKYFLGNLNDRSLFLIDEMGSGTDPAVGGAIAEAALRAMTATGAWGVVTTHYGNLKEIRDPGSAIRDAGSGINSSVPLCLCASLPLSLCASVPLSNCASVPSINIQQPIANGAMLFDSRTLKPLFRLQQGKPGSSFAVEMARGIGFPEEILEQATQLTGGSRLDLEQQLQQVETEKLELEQRSRELEVADGMLHELLEKYDRLKSELEQSKRTMLEEAREEAAQILRDANKLIERTIKEIREAQAEKEQVKVIRKRLEEEKDKIPKDKIQITNKDQITPTKNGSEVQRFRGSKDDNPVSRNAEPGSRNAEPGSRNAEPGSRNPDRGSRIAEFIRERTEGFSVKLDIRGMRADEAFMALQRFVDDALLVSAREVVILHGKGTGVLREVTRDFLRSVKEVRAVQDAPPERGGSGVTEVFF